MDLIDILIIAVAVFTVIFFLGWHFYDTKKKRDEIKILENKLSLANQRLQEVDKEKKEFIDIIMHEINTPLAVISGYLSMILELARKDMKPKIAELIQKSYESTQKIAKVTNDLMATSNTVLESRPQAVQLEEIIRKVADNFSKVAESAGIYLSIKPPAKIPLPLVLADPLAMQTIMTNLIDNAIKFTKRGGIVIETDPQENEVLVKISDTGVGIPKSSQKRVFEKFFQVDSSHTREAGGTGVGLYNVKNMVEDQGGKVWVESEEGRGSTLYFTLPLA